MEQNFNDIDNLFKEELGGYTESPPPAVWDALEKRLKGDDKRRVAPFRWWWYVGIVLFATLLGSAVMWNMSRNAANHNEMANTAAIPQQTATTQAPAATGADKTNIASPKQTVKESRSAKATTENNVIANNTDDKTTVSRSRHRRRHVQHTSAHSNRKLTREDMYADSDDDQYIVGGNRNSHTSYETSASHEPEYAAEPKTQHNIKVAETDLSPSVHDNNYGSYTAANSSRSKAVTNNHYDIDLSDDAADENANRQPKNSITRSRPAHEILYASTLKPVRTRTKAVSTSIANPGVVTSSAPTVKTNTKKGHTMAENKTPKNETARYDKPEVIAAKARDNTAAGKNTEGAVAQTSGPHATREHSEKAQTKMASTGTTPSVTMATPSVKEGKKQPAANTNEPVAATTQVKTHSRTPKEHADKPVTVKESNSKPVANTNAPAVVASAPTGMIRHKTGKAKEVMEHNVSNTNAAASTVAPDHAPAQIASAAAPTTTHQHATAKVKTVKEPAKAAARIDAATTTATPVTKKKEHGPEQAGTKYLAGSTASVKGTEQHSTGKKTTTQNSTAAIAETDVKQQPVEKTVARKTNHKDAVAEEKRPDATAKTGMPGTKNTADIKSPKTTPTTGKTAPAETPAIAKNENKEPKKGSARGTKNSSNKNNAPVPQHVYAYSNSLQQFTLADETVLVDNLKINTFADHDPIVSSGEEQAIGTFKNNDNNAGDTKSAAAGTTAENTDSTAKHHHFSTKFEYGVKAGYETAFNSYGANKLVISPYLQYNLNDKFSLLTQPSIKVSHVSQHHVGQDTSYNDRSHGVYTLTESGAFATVVYTGGYAVTILDTLRKYDFSYDSIVKSYGTDRTYMEIELPLLLKYNIGKGFSVYGGANSVYSKYTNLTEHSKTYNATYHTLTLLPASSPAILPNTANLNLPGTAISKHTGPLYPEQKGSLLRIGYMLGFSYEYKNRWLFDVLAQQAMVKPHYEAGVNTNQPLSLPYFRFTVGYKLSK